LNASRSKTARQGHCRAVFFIFGEPSATSAAVATTAVEPAATVETTAAMEPATAARRTTSESRGAAAETSTTADCRSTAAKSRCAAAKSGTRATETAATETPAHCAAAETAADKSVELAATRKGVETRTCEPAPMLEITEIMEVAYEARSPSPPEPRTDADKNPVVEILRPPISIRRASVRGVRIVAIRAVRRRSVSAIGFIVAGRIVGRVAVIGRIIRWRSIVGRRIRAVALSVVFRAVLSVVILAIRILAVCCRTVILVIVAGTRRLRLVLRSCLGSSKHAHSGGKDSSRDGVFKWFHFFPFHTRPGLE
jgi:hypothetical protein